MPASHDEVGKERSLAGLAPALRLDFTPSPSPTMAYNREWDRGKEAWTEQNWNDYAARGNVRGREDELQGDGKRRKFNDGVRCATASEIALAQTRPLGVWPSAV